MGCCNAEGEKQETLRQKDHILTTLWRAKGHQRIKLSMPCGIGRLGRTIFQVSGQSA